MWRNSFEQFLLINPSIGNSFSVPPPLNHASKNHMLGVRSINITGFGYDSLTNDYKIVEIVEYDFFGLRIRDTLVYSLMSNSWKVVESTSPPKATLKYSEAGALINNHLLHWLFPSFSRRITCFDLRKEKWVQNVPFPDDDVPVYGRFEDDKQDNLVHLGVFEGSTLYYTYPLCYRDGSRDEVLLGIGGECGLFFKIRWYKAKDKLSRIAEIQTIHEVNHKRILEVYICNGSLVTIPGSIQIKTEEQP
uniref:F-box associated beta-propeller type 1 domain-containing protein n=1 Tax=Chenopodium quinoa TaxID=63459 RepID=A0A803LHC8_CHEQI